MKCPHCDKEFDDPRPRWYEMFLENSTVELLILAMAFFVVMRACF